MNNYSIPYHRSELRFTLPRGIFPDIYSAINTPGLIQPAQHTADRLGALENISQLLPGKNKAKTIAIAINDNTRPVPYKHLLPPLLNWLYDNGIPKSEITFFIANGTHKSLTHEETKQLLPENIANNIRLLSHNCDNREDLIFLGNTRLDTPVWINRDFYLSDYKIVIGNIEPHHFMGFSGGVKTASIGLAGRDTITKNHKMLLLPEAKAGNYANNPMRMDIEEIGDMIGIQLALNVLLNDEKQIIDVLAGNPRTVMDQGIAKVRNLMMVKPPGLYDIVIASAGGYPKDINLYQAQKAMTHASYFIKEGGIIILAAACSEGFGNVSFENFVRSISTRENILNYLNIHPFEIGPHKALQIAKITHCMETYLISEINNEIPTFLLKTAPTIEQALDQTGLLDRTELKLAILPSATHTIPFIK